MKRFITIIITLAALTSLTGCTDSGATERVLATNGYTDIHTTGYRMFMCSSDDDYSTGFTAKAPGGQTVSGAVCSSFDKGNTIRFD